MKSSRGCMAETLSGLTPRRPGTCARSSRSCRVPKPVIPSSPQCSYFLTEHRTEGKTWLEHGCIVFSQYYDTVYWIGAELAEVTAR